MVTKQTHRGLLGDTAGRDYGTKLDRFAEFAAPELDRAIDGLGLADGDRVLDAGCGSGVVTRWLARRVAPSGFAVGIDLASAHVRAAAEHAPGAALVQGDLTADPFQQDTFDLIWASNTINHLSRPADGAARLGTLLRPGGRLVVAQSAFLPDMVFAWDARLESEVTRACREYFRDKYVLSERDTAGVRNLVGFLQEAGLRDVRAQTLVIERTPPLTPADEAYFVETVFGGYWGEHVRPYLEPKDWEELQRLCRPDSEDFCLRRPDFHHIQTFTIVVGRA